MLIWVDLSLIIDDSKPSKRSNYSFGKLKTCLQVRGEGVIAQDQEVNVNG